MHSFGKKELQVCSDSEDILILNTYEEFRKWYLRHHDLTMFAQDDIEGLLREERPETYPCVPLLTGDRFEAIYLSTDLLECWEPILNGNKASK